jgi:amino acid permease
MFAKITYGAAGSLIVKLVIIINNVGMCCAYFRIFGETSDNLAAVFADSESFWVKNWHNFLYVLIIFFVMGFLIFKDNLDSLKSASFLGVLGITTFFFCLVTIFIYKLSQGLIPEYSPSVLLPQGEALDIIGALPTVFLAFTFQFNAFPVYFTLKKRTKSEMTKAANCAIFFCLFVYAITGLLGYYMYRNDLKDTILQALTLDVKKFKDSDSFMIVILVIVNIAFLMSSTMSIPLMFFSLKNNFINTIVFCKKKFGSKRVEVDQSENLLKSVDNEGNKLSISTTQSEDQSLLSNYAKYTIIVLLYISIGVITILVPGLKVVSILYIYKYIYKYILHYYNYNYY